MTKIRIFSGKSPVDVEKAVNEFISDSRFELVDIKFDNVVCPVGMCGPTITHIDIYCRALLIYKDRTEEIKLREAYLEALKNSPAVILPIED